MKWIIIGGIVIFAVLAFFKGAGDLNEIYDSEQEGENGDQENWDH